VGPARFGFAPKLLLVQPGQLPFERFELLHTPADHEHQLRAGALGGQSLGFPLLLALDRSGMLGPVIMSGLSITPLPQRGRWLARRANLLVEAKHEIKRSRVRAACPAQNAGIGGFTEGLLPKCSFLTTCLPWFFAQMRIPPIKFPAFLPHERLERHYRLSA
jgi:hypothetical protein